MPSAKAADCSQHSDSSRAAGGRKRGRPAKEGAHVTHGHVTHTAGKPHPASSTPHLCNALPVLAAQCFWLTGSVIQVALPAATDHSQTRLQMSRWPSACVPGQCLPLSTSLASGFTRVSCTTCCEGRCRLAHRQLLLCLCQHLDLIVGSWPLKACLGSGSKPATIYCFFVNFVLAAGSKGAGHVLAAHQNCKQPCYSQLRSNANSVMAMTVSCFSLSQGQDDVMYSHKIGATTEAELEKQFATPSSEATLKLWLP